MIYADFESILVTKENRKKNLNKPYTHEYQKHVSCGYGYKLVSVDDTFSKPFKSYLGEDTVHNFINSIDEESKHCSDVMKKHFNKELRMTKKDDEDFENFIKCWICDKVYVDGDAKVKAHCHITRKYRVSKHRDCNINHNLNSIIKIPSYSTIQKIMTHILLCKN